MRGCFDPVFGLQLLNGLEPDGTFVLYGVEKRHDY